MSRTTNTILSPSIPNPQYKKYLKGRLTLTLIIPSHPSRCESWNDYQITCQKPRPRRGRTASRPRLLTPAAASRLRPVCVSPASGLRAARGHHALTFGLRAKTNIFGNVRKIELSSLVQSVVQCASSNTKLKRLSRLTYREVSEPVLRTARSRIKSRPLSLLKEIGSHRGYF